MCIFPTIVVLSTGDRTITEDIGCRCFCQCSSLFQIAFWRSFCFWSYMWQQQRASLALPTCLCIPRCLQAVLKHSRCLSDWRVSEKEPRTLGTRGKGRTPSLSYPEDSWKLPRPRTPETSFSWKEVCWGFFPTWWETHDLRCTVNKRLGVQCSMVNREHSVVRPISRTFILHDWNPTPIEQQLPISPSAPSPWQPPFYLLFL